MGFLYALLFAVVIIVILSWDPELEPAVVNAENKREVQKIYRWLRTSSFMTIPILLMMMFGMLTNYYSANNSDGFVHRTVFAIVISATPHLVFFAVLNTKNLFVYRHKQQALALVVLRMGTAAWALNGGGVGVFLLVNGLLWLFGTGWGNRQLKRNTCWLMTRKHEEIILAAGLLEAELVCPSCRKKISKDDVFCQHCGKAVKIQPEAAEPHPEKISKPATEMISLHMAQVILDEGLRLFVQENNKKAATKKLLLAFQSGTPDIRQRAVAVLDKLGEVEKF